MDNGLIGEVEGFAD